MESRSWDEVEGEETERPDTGTLAEDIILLAIEHHQQQAAQSQSVPSQPAQPETLEEAGKSEDFVTAFFKAQNAHF